MSATKHRSPGETYAGYTQLECLTCPNCGVLHAIPEHMANYARFAGGSAYCPNGHSYSWSCSKKIEKLEAEVERRRNATAAERAYREQAEASARAQKAAATRARRERDKDRRRVANGVCPCCGRTFKQLARHMKTKHPDFIEESDAAHK